MEGWKIPNAIPLDTVPLAVERWYDFPEFGGYLGDVGLWGWNMANLKKGTKGKSVKDLQIKLNKAGAKPPLKDDGEFGPITEKAVKAFQKKFGLKTDGKVGDYTLATITFGKKLPEMRVGDYASKGKIWSKFSDNNEKIASTLGSISMQILHLGRVFGNLSEGAIESIFFNRHNYRLIASIAKGITLRQKAFKSELIKNPKKAEKLAKECEDLEHQLKKIGNTQIIPASRFHSSAIKRLQKSIDHTFGDAKTDLKGLEKFDKSSY